MTRSTVTPRQVAEIGDIAVTIGAAQTDLKRVQDYLENRLGKHRDVASVAAQLLAGLEETKKRLAVARVQCLMLMEGDEAVRQAREAAEQFGLLH